MTPDAGTQSMDKLRTYKVIKEKYLEILPDRNKENPFTGKRVDERLCTMCNNIEDEIHW